MVCVLLINLIVLLIIYLVDLLIVNLANSTVYFTSISDCVQELVNIGNYCNVNVDFDVLYKV